MAKRWEVRIDGKVRSHVAGADELEAKKAAQAKGFKQFELSAAKGATDADADKAKEPKALTGKKGSSKKKEKVSA